VHDGGHLDLELEQSVPVRPLEPIEQKELRAREKGD
jgi:hypothetical protein